MIQNHIIATKSCFKLSFTVNARRDQTKSLKALCLPSEEMVLVNYSMRGWILELRNINRGRGCPAILSSYLRDSRWYRPCRKWCEMGCWNSKFSYFSAEKYESTRRILECRTLEIMPTTILLCWKDESYAGISKLRNLDSRKEWVLIQDHW